MTEIEQRIADWVACSRINAAIDDPVQIFERALCDMRAAGFRLPAEVVAGVRAALAAPAAGQV